MRKRILSVVVILFMLFMISLPVLGAGKWNSWWKPREWFGKKQRSTTVTGMIDSVAEDKIVFKTIDAQEIILIGDKAAKVAEKRGVKIRVFGNVIKPNQKYPLGALQVRNFKLLEDAVVTPKEVPIGDEASLATTQPEPYLEPEPVVEPEPNVEPEPYVEPEPVANSEPVAEPEPYVEEPSPPPVPAEEGIAEIQEHSKPESDFIEYTVVSGDTLGKISQKIYGTTAKWKEIAQFNGITEPKLLRVGMTLRIPKH